MRSQKDKAPVFASQKENVDAQYNKVFLKHKRQLSVLVRKELDVRNQELGGYGRPRHKGRPSLSRNCPATIPHWV